MERPHHYPRPIVHQLLYVVAEFIFVSLYPAIFYYFLLLLFCGEEVSGLSTNWKISPHVNVFLGQDT